MSIKLMAQLWEHADVTGSELLVLLALADFANDDGSSIYPAMKTIASKARLSVDQARRVVHKLIDSGVLELVEQGGWIGKRNRPNEYRIVMQSPCILQGPGVDARTSEAPENDVDARGGTGVDASTVLAPVQEDPSVNHQLKATEEKEEAHARDPLTVAWRQAYESEIPQNLVKRLNELAIECSVAAAIHGIKASAAKPDGRNYRYIAECARNYVPPPPMAAYASGSAYSNGAPELANVPGIVPMPPSTNGHKPAPLPAPMPTDDPWAIALDELTRANLPWAHWLAGSALQANGVLAGEPLYRLTLSAPGANAEWMAQQAESAIRKKLASILGKRILLEIITEQVPA